MQASFANNSENKHKLPALGNCLQTAEKELVKLTKHLLYIHIGTQKLYHLVCSKGEKVKLASVYPVSTSAKPPSCVENSLGTPLGLHRIAQKIGDTAQLNTVFQSRVDLHVHFFDYLKEDASRDCVTTRILWLEGSQKGVNKGQLPDGRSCDSHDRYIYIHGTHDELAVEQGIPRSHGCIRMKNVDILKLYNIVPEGTIVWIEA